MSTDEQVDLIKDQVEKEGDDDDVKEFEDASDEEKEAFASIVETACDGEDDDTKLDDIE